MPGITAQNILDDVRVLYDINVGEKALKLNLFIRQTIDDITASIPGALTNKTTTLTVASGQLAFPADFEIVYAMYVNSNEMMPIDIVTKMRMDNRVLMSQPYCIVSTTAAGNIVAEVTNASNGTAVDIAYKRRISDVTIIPEMYRYIVLDGVSWRYEKYEQKLNESQYMITYNKYKEQIEDIAVRLSTQDNWTNKFNYADEWTAVLSRI
jgi:hypothetical protein